MARRLSNAHENNYHEQGRMSPVPCNDRIADHIAAEVPGALTWMCRAR